MNSRDYAVTLRKLAEELDTLPSFPVPRYSGFDGNMSYFYDKDGFLAAVKALGSGRKDMNAQNVRFFPAAASFHLTIERHLVCHKVKEAEYDCEPLLSQIEDMQIPDATGVPA